MIKTIIFDLDGVLVDTKKIHYVALNKALKFLNKNLSIKYNEHINFYDGLSTVEKLKILNRLKKLDPKYNNDIILLKQKYTSQLLNTSIKFNQNVYSMFKNLKNKYNLCIATNAIKKTLDICTEKLRINDFVDYKISNQEVKNQKPHPEIYLKCMIETSSKPSECLILEDSHFGRLAAQESGGILLPVRHLNEVNLKFINNFIQNFSQYSETKNHWSDKSLNILIPMAGAGSRFEMAGYTFPKPLVEAGNKPIIQWVVESLNLDSNYIFLVQREHQNKYNISSMLKILKPNCKIIYLDGLTEGAACTTLLAKKFINNNKPLIIANSDQFIEWNTSQIMYNFYSKKIDGGILCFNSSHPRWSYAKVDKNNYVKKVAEKKVISNNATVGLYFWKKGKDYVKYAEQMIKKNIRVNNEFYVCPVYNEAIKNNKKIVIEKVEKMWGLGTPDDLNFFIKQKLK